MLKENIDFLVPSTTYIFRWEESPRIEVLKAKVINSQWLYEEVLVRYDLTLIKVVQIAHCGERILDSS